MTATSANRDRGAGRMRDALQREAAGGVQFPRPPPWVREVFDKRAQPMNALSRDALSVWVAESQTVALLTAVVQSAGDLPDRAFESVAGELYAGLGDLLRTRGEFALRFWNYVPGIRKPAEEGFRRYEVFNAGRFRGFERWQEAGEACLPFAASSGVGAPSANLVVHLLAGTSPGRPLENPRQRPAYHYSPRYGRLPPCFSRATVLSRPVATAAGPVGVVVSGTASVVGEDSVHPGSLRAQVEEVRHNLASIWTALTGEAGEEDVPERTLSNYRHLRMYVVDERYASEAVGLLCDGFPPPSELEIVVTDLCRPDLLVEVEGTLPPLALGNGA